MIETEEFGRFAGQKVSKFTMRNRNNVVLELMDWGAVLLALRLPDGHGAGRNIVLGFRSFDPYPDRSPYFGATCGRVANRIAGGKFELDDKIVELACNEGAHHLHGGVDNFAKRIWSARVDQSANAVNFQLASPDGDQGYPGAVMAGCTYRLDDDNCLEITMTALATAATPVNMAHHSYWNLDGAGTVDRHRLKLMADRYLPTGEGQIPTGEIVDVADTIFDFRDMRRLDALGEPLIDHCFALPPSDDVRPAVALESSDGAVSMMLETNQPGVQIYTGFKLNVPAEDGGIIGPRSGICMETQAYPNAVNEPNFPSSIVRPGQSYHHVMKHHLQFR